MTVQDVIDRARSRHWSFFDGNDGAAVAFLNERQRALLLQVSRTAEAIVGESEEIDTSGTETLVAVDALGVPYFTTTVEDGFAVRFTSQGVPYINTADDAFVTDPFGEDGNVPGLPLPTDLLRLIWVVAMTSESPVVPRRIEVLNAEAAYKAPSMLGLRAFLSDNRLVPIRTANQDIWSIVTSIRVGFIRCPELAALTDEITVPTPLIHAMTAALTEFFAVGSKECPQPDKNRFEKQRIDADALLDQTVNSLDAVTASTVIYKR